MRVPLPKVHRPMPRCQTVSMRVWGLSLPHGDLHARRFPVPPQLLPHLENPNALMLSTGLCNPELCGGVAPHEFLFVRCGLRQGPRPASPGPPLCRIPAAPALDVMAQEAFNHRIHLVWHLQLVEV